LAAIAGLVVAIGAAAVLYVRVSGGSEAQPPPSGCRIGSGPRSLALTLNQAESASTIAAVGSHLGLPRRAVTVALATALQESKLLNIPFGDRDSLGLFQQRPSQGWGTRRQLLNPSYAATAFYRHLRTVSGWRGLPLAVAAQDVQHSADGSAYAQWEEVADVLSRVLTGAFPAGMACQFERPASYDVAGLRQVAGRELGSRPFAPSGHRSDWLAAEWLVAHAYGYGVGTVSIAGREWSAQAGSWTRQSPAASNGALRFTMLVAPTPSTPTGATTVAPSP
jgi:hypothetical protein